ncbi:MAG: sigma-70 family RNA polymerase sigma factor [Chloroflexi bacterium]|nr:sigma-70 family RNA polymerase sigma factor [Chloroflexota bacterium]
MTIDWGGLYEAHAAVLAGYLAKLVGDRDAGTELMQETFVRGLRHEHSIDEPRAAIRWLFRTATNLASNHRRRAAILRFLPFSGHESAQAEAFDVGADQVRTALRSIPVDQAAALLLFYDNGFDRREIASMLGLSEEAVKSRLARGRANFKAAYGRLERGLAR